MLTAVEAADDPATGHPASQSSQAPYVASPSSCMSTAHQGAPLSESCVVHSLYSTPLYLKGNTQLWQFTVQHLAVQESPSVLGDPAEGGSWALAASQMLGLQLSPRHRQPWPLGTSGCAGSGLGRMVI